jgi:ribonuclease BN (tRNA processing enzyme)
MGLRVTDGRSVLAYLSDHAPQDLGPGADGLGARHEAACELADGADVLIHDAQYTAAELPTRGSFGHCAADYAVALGRECRVGRVLLFHHDPRRDDDEVEALTTVLQNDEKPIVEAAIEGRTYAI